MPKFIVIVSVMWILMLFGIETAMTEPPLPPQGPALLNELDIYVKVFGGIVTGLGTLFGLPATLLYFRKTRAEIRKLELEAAALSSKATSSQETAYGNQVTIHDSYNNNIQIMTDPRFLVLLASRPPKASCAYDPCWYSTGTCLS
jgi:hypothetical protein